MPKPGVSICCVPATMVINLGGPKLVALQNAEEAVIWQQTIKAERSAELNNVFNQQRLLDSRKKYNIEPLPDLSHTVRKQFPTYENYVDVMLESKGLSRGAAASTFQKTRSLQESRTRSSPMLLSATTCGFDRDNGGHPGACEQGWGSGWRGRMDAAKASGLDVTKSLGKSPMAGGTSPMRRTWCF
eukprot:TRINITY_DN15876_c0_g1_i1.p1 TRINITY_DN15876_c0_g1~~TRINITY_DN15876_c0_g1_i1.p1  ORF type:complete len:186 (-),score=16.70 TRINITY_DN15876_c0_g1_i1:375-932(-)